MLAGVETDKTPRRPRYWTIARQSDSHADAITIDPDGQGEALVVFGFREEAELFLAIEETGDDLQIRETTAGELISVLYGPCADVDRVVIDPLPRRIAGRTGTESLSIGSAEFTRNLVESCGTASGAMPALVSLRP